MPARENNWFALLEGPPRGHAATVMSRSVRLRSAGTLAIYGCGQPLNVYGGPCTTRGRRKLRRLLLSGCRFYLDVGLRDLGRGFELSHRTASPWVKPSWRMRFTASSRVNPALLPSCARYRSTMSSSSTRMLSYERGMTKDMALRRSGLCPRVNGHLGLASPASAVPAVYAIRT